MSGKQQAAVHFLNKMPEYLDIYSKLDRQSIQGIILSFLFDLLKYSCMIHQRKSFSAQLFRWDMS